MDLSGALAGGKLAMADPAAVPAGKYGKAALESLGVWDSVSGSVAAAENVRAALALVSLGEAPLGIVYQTDATADPDVRIVDVFPEDSHPPIIYPVALIAASDDPDAAALLEYLRSDSAKAAFEKQGFTVLR
jgi:molybdate transport system substrate-binding protein